MRAEPTSGFQAAPDSASSAWPRYAATWAALVVAILLLFRRDALHLFRVWWDNATFGHCLLIVPIVAWLVWQRREGLMRLAPMPWLPGAGLMLLVGLLWLLGDLAGVAVVRHAALVLMVIASVPTILGLAVTRGLAFPLFFLLFAIPVGEQFVPHLQTITARFCMALLDLVGIPAYSDGVFISIPTGNFEVAEACSGVRFLIAMVAFGALVSNVCFKSWRRRAAFMAASVIVPIVANGFRAWGTIYIAHLTTLEFAQGIDHIVYGWFFFAFVLALTLAIGWRFFDRPVDDPMIEPERLQRPGRPAGAGRTLAVAGVVALAATAATPAFAAFAARRPADETISAVRLMPPPGWRSTDFTGEDWRPNYVGAKAAMASFVDAGGQPVELYLAVYDRQREGQELVGYQQGVLPVDGPWAWAGNDAPPPGGSAMQINAGPVVREVWQYYLVNGRVVGSPVAAKLEGLKARFGGPTRAATLIVSAERVDPVTAARPAIDRFVRALGPVDEYIEQATLEPIGS